MATKLASIAERRSELPATIGLFDRGALSADQVGVIARRVPADLDAQFAEQATMMTVPQLSRAVRLAVPAEAKSDPLDPDASVRELSHGFDDDGTWYLRIRADKLAGASFDAGLRAHYDALVNEHRIARLALPEAERPGLKPPTWFDAFVRLVERSLAAEVAERPWNSRTKVVVHLEADRAALHLGPALTPAERRLVSCDATIQSVLTRFGVPVDVGREHRITPDATRLVVERRDGACRHPLCSRRGKLVIHHIVHWEHGGPTDTRNLLALCPSHHRSLHAGRWSVSGDADDTLDFRDAAGRPLIPPEPQPDRASPPTPAERYRHPVGEPVNWLWLDPLRPGSSPSASNGDLIDDPNARGASDFDRNPPRSPSVMDPSSSVREPTAPRIPAVSCRRAGAV